MWKLNLCWWTLLLHLLSTSLSLKQRETPPKHSSSKSSSEYYEDVPWSSGSDKSSVLEASRYEEQFSPITFSPNGRLHQVEAAVKASKLLMPSSNVVIAMKCREGLVVFSTLPTSPFLNTTEIRHTSVVSNGDDEVEKNLQQKMEGDETGKATVSISYPSLFLLEETCQSTTTSPIMLDGPLLRHDLVAATGGNTVYGIFFRHVLSQLIASTVQDVSGLEPIVSAGKHVQNRVEAGFDGLSARRLAHDLANALQVGTQDMSKAQVPLMASSLILLGQKEIWRIDPTGQFWESHAAVAGQDAHAIEEALYKTLLEKKAKDNSTNNSGCGNTHKSVQSLIRYMESLPHDEALILVEECLTSHYLSILKKVEAWFGGGGQSKPDSLSISDSEAVPKVYWHAVVLDYTNISGKRKGREGGACTKIVRRGTILLRPSI